MPGDQTSFFRHLGGALYPHGLDKGQVAGHEAILARWQTHHAGGDIRWLAYILATAYHESARTMQPVRETLAGSDEEAAERLERAWRSGRMPQVTSPYWRRDGKGRYWFGRGLVQLTFEANYRRLGALIGVDLAADPDRALELDVAVRIMVQGMMAGSFTGRRLSEFFNATTEDWSGARRIVNGMDRAEAIAGYARVYRAALGTALPPSVGRADISPTRGENNPGQLAVVDLPTCGGDVTK